MKTSKIILSILTLGAAGLITSCVDPYYAGGGTTTTVTHYQPGYMVDTLPGGYRTESIGGVSYYRHNDVYYRPQGRRYVVVERPGRGYGRGPDRHDGRDRYDRGPNRNDRGPGRQTSIIRTLPSGARVVTHRGERYYESRGTYYRPSSGGYMIVGKPF